MLRTEPVTTAGITLRAVDAIESGQQTFTREQAAYLMHLAFDAGRTATHLEDVAEVHCAAQDNATMRATYEAKVAVRMAEMSAAADRINHQLGRPPGYRYDGGPVDWETGAPLAALVRLAAA
ncbi:hypothetical protein ACIBF5_09900 [Micromonospora sp. NPDC050417]|uniref:hypothetical protein n=1 Tax=Micromonospora sp. NPDC050417 TaxID=3364280 RepID=UPI0037B4814A